MTALDGKNRHLVRLVEESRVHDTPAFWISEARLQANYQAFTANFAGAAIFYAVKANPHPAVLRVLEREGASFDAASLAEVRASLDLGIEPRRIAFTTPVKSPAEIAAAARLGVEVFVVDCEMEVDKIAAGAPGRKVLVRIQAANTGSQWPLSRRFGIQPEHAVDLLDLIRARNLVAHGLTFHVGSQCVNPKNWSTAIRRCAEVWKEFERRSGQRLAVLDIGGGYPVEYREPVPTLEEISEEVHREITTHWGTVRPELWIEPGRRVVGDSAIATASVIGRAERSGRTWVFLDVGAFNGLLELIEPSSNGFEYEVWADRREGDATPDGDVVLAGPSCDGDDVLSHEVLLPPVELGDRVHFLRAGAYSLSYCSRFCGNALPTVHVV